MPLNSGFKKGSVMIKNCENMEQAKAESRRLSKETGDIYCAMKWKGEWIIYALGFGPVVTEEEDA